MIHVIDPGYPGWMWWIWGSVIALGLIVAIMGVGIEEPGAIGSGAFMIFGGAVLGLLFTVWYESDYNSAVETAITLEGYSNVSYDGESTFTAASPTGEYFSGYLAPVGDDTFKIVEIPS